MRERRIYGGGGADRRAVRAASPGCGASAVSGVRQTRGVRKIHVIGIGAGDPDQLTLQAVKALRSTDVFFILDKGEVKSDLVQLRRDILDAHIPQGSYRLVEARDPDRDRAAGGTAYSPPSATGAVPAPTSTSG